MLGQLSLRILTSLVVLLASTVVPQLKPVLTAEAQSADLGGGSPTNRIAITSVDSGDRSLSVGWSISALESSAEIRWRVKDVWPSSETVSPSTWSTETLTGPSLETKYTISGLVNGVTYEIQMRAYSAQNGYSLWSNTASTAPRSSTTVDPDVALSSLSIDQSTDGTSFSALPLGQSPAFSPNLTDYHLVVLDESTHLRLNPRSRNTQALIESRKGSTSILSARNGPTHTVPLDLGDNTIVLRVTDAANSKTQDYNVHVLRLVIPPTVQTPILGAAADGTPSATLRHDAPPVGFRVGLQVKSAGEEWSVSPVQLPAGVSLERASSTGSATTARSAVLKGFAPGQSFSARTLLFTGTGEVVEFWYGDAMTGETVSFTTWEAPSAPSALRAETVMRDHTQLNAAWTAPSSNGGAGAQVTGYRLRWRVADADGDTPGDQPGTWNSDDGVSVAGTSHTIASLSELTAYQVQVRAVNGIDPGSEWSAVAEGTTSMRLAPESFEIVPGDSTLTVSWGGPDRPYTSADVRWRLRDSDPTSLGDQSGAWLPDANNGSRLTAGELSAKSVTLVHSSCIVCDQLSNGVAYDVEMRFRSSFGASAWVEAGSASPNAPPTKLDLSVGEQPPTTLVSNFRQQKADADLEYHYFGQRFGWAQAFTTGDNADGYELASIDVGLLVAGAGTLTETDRKQIQAELWSSAFGSPARKIADLTVPSSVSTGAVRFAAPLGTGLSASTTYFVILRGPDLGRRLAAQTTASDNEDDTGVANWSIADGASEETAFQSRWADPNRHSVLLRANGYVATRTYVAESAGSVMVTATLDNPATSDVTVALSAVTGTTATAAADYVLPAAFTISGGAKEASARVTVVDDHIPEQPEELVLGASAGDLAVSGTAFTIVDDDTPGVTLSETELSITLGESDSYTAVLDSMPSATVELSFSIDAAHVRVPDTLTFTSADWNTAQTVTVESVSAGEAVVSHAASSTDPGYGSDLVIDEVTVTVDPLPEPTSLTLSAPATVPEGGGSVTVTVSLDEIATQDTVVTLVGAASSTATAGSDFVLPKAFTIAEGSITANVSLAITDDAVVEGGETIVLSAAASGLSVAGVRITITDDDVAGVVVSDTEVATYVTGVVHYTLKLSSEPASAVTIGATSSVSTVAPIRPATLTFTPADWSTPQSITVSGLKTGASTISHKVSSDDSNYSAATAASVDVRVRPNQKIYALRGVSAKEGADALLTVALRAPAPEGGLSFVVSYDFSGSASLADTGTRPTSVTVPAGARSAVVRVPLADDEFVERDETFQATISTLRNDWSTTFTANVATVTIVDVDRSEAVIGWGTDLSDGTPSFDERVQEDVASGKYLIPVTISHLPAEETVFPIWTVRPAGHAEIPQSRLFNPVGARVCAECFATETVDYSVTPKSITFTPDGPKTKYLEVTIHHNPYVEYDKDIWLDFEYVNEPKIPLKDYYRRTNGWLSRLRIVDADQAGVKFSETSVSFKQGATGSYTARLTSQPRADVTLNLSSDDEIVASVPSTLTFTTENWNTAQTVTITNKRYGNATISHTVDSDDRSYKTSIETSTICYGSGADRCFSYQTGLLVDSVDVSVIAPPPTLVTLSHRVPVVEGSGPAEVTATLDYPAKVDTSVTLSATAASTAVASADYTLPGAFTIAQGELSAKVDVPIVDDDLVEFPENLVLTATAGSLSRLGTKIKIDDDDAADARIAFGNSASSTTMYTANVDEDVSGGKIQVPVIVSHLPSAESAFGIKFAAVGGAATRNLDYSITPDAVTFTSTGSKSRTLEITITDDLIAEGQELIVMTVDSSNQPTDSLSPFYNRSHLGAVARIAIVDDDSADVEVSESELTFEVKKAEEYTLKLTSQPTSSVTVTPRSSDTNVATVSDPVTFSTSDWATAQTVTVTGASAGTVSITHGASSSDANYGTSKSIDSVDVKVLHPPPSTLRLSVPSTVNEDAGSVTVTATLDYPARVDTSVSLTAADSSTAESSDYTLPGTFTIAKGKSSASSSIAIVDDELVEFAETIVLDATVGELSVTGATVTIVDDDYLVARVAFGVDANPGKHYQGRVNENFAFGYIDIPITVSHLPESDFTLNISRAFSAYRSLFPSGDVAEESDYSIATSSVTFGPDKSKTQTLRVTIVNDDVSENDEDIPLILAAGSKPAADLGDYYIRSHPGSFATARIVNDDSAGVTVSESDMSIVEGSTATYTVILDSEPTAQVVVSSTSSVSSKVTVAPTARTFTTANWNTAQTFTVSGVDVGTATVSHASASTDTDYGSSLEIDSIDVTVIPPLALTLSAPATIAEDAGSATVTATLNRAVGADVEVTLAAGSGTTASTADYTLPPALTIAKGETTATAEVAIVNDEIVELTEKLVLTATVAGVAVTPTTMNITESRSPTIDFGLTATSSSVYKTKVDENVSAGLLKLPVTISHLPQKTITFSIGSPPKCVTSCESVAIEDTDYSISNRSISFQPSGSKTQYFTVTILDDDIDAADVQFQLFIDDPLAPNKQLAQLYEMDGSGDVAIVTIEDDDTAGVTVSESSITVLLGSSSEYTVVLDSQPTATVFLHALVELLQLKLLKPVTFTTANWDTAQTFTVTGTATGTSTITHSTSSTDSNYGSTLAVDSVEVTVENPPPSSLTISLTAYTVDEDAGDVTVTATFNQPVKAARTVTFSATENTAKEGAGFDFTVPDAFTAVVAVGQTVGTATVTILDDDIDEADETFALTASDGQLVATPVGVTIQDNDTAGVTVSEDALTITKGQKKTYTIVLDTQPTSQVTITPTSGTTAVATVAPTARTFTAGNWATAQTFTVSGVATGTSTVTHAASSTDDNYSSTLEVDDVDVTVENPDPSTLTVTLTNTTVAENAGDVTITATFDQPVKAATTVTFTATAGTATGGGADYSVPATFTGIAAKGQSTATAIVTIVNDDLDETNETFTLKAAAGSIESAAVTVTIQDDDTAGVTVSEDTLTVVKGQKKTYTVVLDSEPTSQVTITPTSGTTAVATVAPTARTFTTSDWDTAQTFTVTGKTTGTSNITHGASSTDDDYGESLSVDDVDVTVENPDPSTLTVSLTNTTVAETVGDITVTATFDQPVKAATTVTFTATAGTATGGGADYSVPNTFTGIAAKGQSTATATVTIEDDNLDENNETFDLKASAGSIESAAVTVTITDDDTAGVTVSEDTLTVVKGQKKTYTVVLDSEPTSQVTITPTSGTTAVATVAPTARTFTTSDWDTAQTFTVTGKTTGTSNITHGASSTDDDYGESLSVDDVDVTVENPDPSTLTVSLTNTTVAENVGDITVTATFDQPVKAATTVTFTATAGTATGGGADYSVPNTFTGVAAKGQSTATATVTIEDDNLDETNETFSLAASAGTLTAAAVTVTITDDDTAGVTVSEDALTVVKGQKKTYTVVLDSEPTSQVTITPTSGTTAVATVAPTARTFTTSDWGTAQTFTVTGKTTGTSNITHAASSTDDDYGESLSVDDVDVTVENPDPSSLTVSLTNTTVAENVGDVTVTATFDQPVKAATTVTFTATAGTATGGGADYSVPNTFTGIAAKGQSTATATVTIEDDNLDENNETFSLAASAGSLSAAAVTVTITDDDTAGVTVSEDALTITKGQKKTYTIVLDTQPTSQVTITPTSGATAVATVAPTARTFTTSDWDTAQTFTVTGVTSGTSNITHAASSTDDNYSSTLEVDDVDVTVENPDPTTLTVSLTNTTVAENVGDVTVTATFDQPVKAATTVTFTATAGTATGGGADYSVPNTFTGVAAKGQSTATATVTIVNDDLDETNETFTLKAAAGSIESAAVTVTITDDDTAGVTVSEDTLTVVKDQKKTYTVVLDSEPTSQVTITPTSDTTAVATVAPTARTFTTSDWGTAQTFTVTGKTTGTSNITHAASSTDDDYGESLSVDDVDVTVENPDPSTLTVSLTNTTVAENVGDVTVTATFDQPVKAATTVTFTATAGTATGGGADYSVPATFTGVAAKGQSTATATVTIVNDDLDETDETFDLKASAGSIESAAVTVTITDDDTAGVTVSEDTLTVVKGQKKTYTVVLDSEPTSQVTITPTSGATAVATVAPTARTFTTSDWDTAQTFTVTGVTSGTSTVTHAASSTDDNYGSSRTIDSVEVTVENPDPTTLTVSLTNTTVAETAGGVTVTATFDQPVKAATTVTFTATAGTATGGGADYSVPNTFTGVAAKGQSTATATVTIVNDDLDETNETFTLKAAAGSIESATVTVTIQDDDTAAVTVSEDALTITKGQKKTYTIVLDTQPTSQVTITPTSGTTAVATVAPTARTFTTSDWGTAQTFTVTGVTSGTSTVTHGASSTDDNYGSSRTIDSVDVTVENPDPSSLTVSLTNTTVAETAGDVTVTATFDQPVKAATTVTFTATAGTATGGGTDYSVPATFTGVAAKGQSTATATVTIEDDNLDETNETFDLKASAGSIESAAVTVTITDDDTAGVTVSEDTLTVVKGQKKTYTVVLDSEPTSQVTITPTSGATAVATVAPTARTFTTSDWDTAQTFTVTGKTTGTSNITHAASSTDDDYGESLSVDDVDVTVENPDPTTLTVSLTNTTVAETAGDVTVTATFDQPVKAAATVTFTATAGTATGGGADYSVPATFTGIAAKGQSTATAIVTIVNDDLDETDETFSLAASAGTLTAAAVTVTITDDDTAGVTVSEDTLTVVKDQKKTYTIVLDSEPTSQVTITPTSGTPAVATVAPTARTFTTSDWGTAQTFTVTGVTTGTSTVSHAASSTDDNYGESLSVDSVEVTVENPDPSTLTVTLTNTTVAENVGDVTVTATFDQPVKAATTVTFTATAGTATGGGVDYTLPATFTATVATGQKAGTATVTIVDDDLDENNETFALKAAAGSIESAAVTVTIQDDDTAAVTVSEESLTVTKGQKESYTVVLDTQPTSQVIVTPTSGTPAVATVAPTARTFTTSNWGTAQTFTVTGETTGTSNITHAASSTDDNYGESLSVDSVEVTVENPDPSTLTVTLTNTTVAENVGDVTVTATFDQPVKAATTVTFTATAGTATGGGVDYTLPATFTATVATGQKAGTATVTIVDDDLDENNETFALKAAAGSIESAAVTVTIQDDDTAAVTVSEESLTVTKGQKESYTIVLDSEPTSQVTITPTSGTPAVATVAPTARTFTTSDWGTAQTFTVTGVTTGTSTVSHAASSTDDNYGESLSVDSVEVTVENPDPSTLTVTLTNTTVAENVGDVTVTATFDQPVKAATTVTFTATAGTATGGGVDYTLPATFTATVATGQKAGTATVTIVDDDLDENNETFALKAAAGSIESAAVTVTIQDDDTAAVTVSEESLTVTKGQKESYTVVLDTQPTSQVIVTPTSGTPAVATVAPTARTFTTSNWGTAQTFTVTGETTGTSNITHAASSTDDNYGESLSVDSVEVTVENPDPSTLTVTLTNTTVAENVGDVTVTATFDQPVKAATTVTFTATAGTATGGGVDYTLPATFTATVATGQKAGTATVTIVDDDLDENNETFALKAAAGSIESAAVTVTIQDDDTAAVTVSEESLTVTKGQKESYTVVLDTQPTSQVIVTPTSGTPAVATVAPTARTFTTSNWGTAQTFTVTGETTGTSNITHAASSTDDNYGESLSVDSVEVTVENPDPSTLTVTLTNTTVAENVGDVTVTATFDQPVKAATTVTFTATAGTATGGGVDYTLPATFTATVATGQKAGTATVTIVDDDLDENNETFALKAAAGSIDVRGGDSHHPR